MRHLMIWVHCHPLVLSMPGVSWLVAASAHGICWNSVVSEGDTTARAVLTDTCTIPTEMRSAVEARAGVVFSCIDLERPRALRSSSFLWYHFPHAPQGKLTNMMSATFASSWMCLWWGCYFFTFSMVASSKDVSEHLYHTVTSTMNAWISFTKIKSGLCNSLLSFLICGSWNSVQSCFFASFDNISHM